MPRRLATVLLALGAATAAHADYKDSYRKGIEALDRKRWDDVVKHMREAIADNPSEGERIKLYGLRFETYFPHFYLGAAYLNLGKCPEAQRAFETSQTQGAIRNHPKYAELVDGLKSCESQVAKATPAPATPTPKAAGPDPAAIAQAAQAAETAVGRAEVAARAAGVLAGEALLAPVWGREAALGPAERHARESLASARTKLEMGRRASDLVALGEARDLAGEAREALDGVRREAERRRDALRRQASAPTPAPPSPSATAVARAPAAPPPELLAGADAFFGARYDEAIRYLERATGLRARAAAQRALLLAASRFARYRMGGEKDAAVRRQAAEDVAACRRADPSLLPDRTVFSPEFEAFFRSGGDAGR
jgi:tetratricopeptide (TPR) repeat protein